MNDHEARYPDDYWDDGSEYLRVCVILQHNNDYLEFKNEIARNKL
jgi:hypothetical protein